MITVAKLREVNFMQVPIMFIIFFILSVYIRYLIRSSQPADENDHIIAKDMEANFARVKDISGDLFVVPDMSELPFQHNIDANEYARLARSQISVLDKSKEQMIRPNKQISNVDLKLKFGLANLELIANYEENFNQYIWALLRWADALAQKDMLIEAVTVLRHSIDFGSESSKPYITLADVYYKMNDFANIENLLREVELHNIQAKDIIMQHLKNLIKTIEK